MKAPLSRRVVLGCFGAVLAAPVVRSWAIPNQVGGFFNLVGMRFEDFAAREEAWAMDAPLPARWEPWHEPEIRDTAIESLRLSVPAVIFGFPAHQVTARRIEGRTTRFDASFLPGGTAKPSLEQLAQSLNRNAEAWADSGGEGRYVSGATTVELSVDPVPGRVLATFSPAPASPAPAKVP